MTQQPHFGRVDINANKKTIEPEHAFPLSSVVRRTPRLSCGRIIKGASLASILCSPDCFTVR
jgi:hypothetical protein